MKITLTFDLPHAKLRPNNKPQNHGFYRMLVSKRRQIIGFCTIAQIRIMGLEDNLRWQRASVSIVWYARTKMYPDADNALASLKSTIDGIVDAKLLADDRHVRYEPIEFRKDKLRPRLEITLTEG